MAAAARFVPTAMRLDELDEPQLLAYYLSSHGGAWPLARTSVFDDVSRLPLVTQPSQGRPSHALSLGAANERVAMSARGGDAMVPDKIYRAEGDSLTFGSRSPAASKNVQSRRGALSELFKLAGQPAVLRGMEDGHVMRKAVLPKSRSESERVSAAVASRPLDLGKIARQEELRHFQASRQESSSSGRGATTGESRGNPAIAVATDENVDWEIGVEDVFEVLRSGGDSASEERDGRKAEEIRYRIKSLSRSSSAEKNKEESGEEIVFVPREESLSKKRTSSALSAMLKAEGL